MASKDASSCEYQLIVETDEEDNVARFRLLDKNGVQKGDRQVKLPEHGLSFWEGLFDTRRYMDQYAGNLILEGCDKPADREQLLNRLGVFLGTEVLGEPIMKELARSRASRTLLVRLPETGGKHFITGKDLVALFEEAGGFIPQMVFLSACHSGSFIDVKSWEDLRALLTGQKPDAKKTDGEGPFLGKILEEEAGYAGTALNLLRSGVPQVAAMRYEVGDG